jgi:hypothetical protein
MTSPEAPEITLYRVVNIRSHGDPQMGWLQAGDLAGAARPPSNIMALGD